MNGYKITAMKRALNWAVEMGRIEYSPIAKMKRPPVGVRKDVLTANEFETLMRLIGDQEFRDLLEFSWECGARPQEAKRIEARHIEEDIVYIPEEEGKLQQRRTIYLTERAKRLLKQNWREEGPIFRNTRGQPWTSSAVKSRFDRLAERFGRKLCQYTFRHSWINR